MKIIRCEYDTVYVGVNCDTEEENEIFNKIKKCLPFVLSDKEVGNRFYSLACENKENGFVMFYMRRIKNNSNMYLQFNGEYFHKAENIYFFYELIESLFEYLDFSRVDVAIDIQLEVGEFLDVDYLESYKNRKLKKEIITLDNVRTTVRYVSKQSFLRLYNKSLECSMKKKKSYTDVYGINVDKWCGVYRLEWQLRGKKLKSFVDKQKKDIFSGLFFKYSLVHKIFNIWNVFLLNNMTPIKNDVIKFISNHDYNFLNLEEEHYKESIDLINKINYHKKLLNSEFNILVKLYDDLQKRDQYNKEIEAIYSKINKSSLEKDYNTLWDFYKESGLPQC